MLFVNAFPVLKLALEFRLAISNLFLFLLFLICEGMHEFPGGAMIVLYFCANKYVGVSSACTVKHFLSKWLKAVMNDLIELTCIFCSNVSPPRI